MCPVIPNTTLLRLVNSQVIRASPVGGLQNFFVSVECLLYVHGPTRFSFITPPNNNKGVILFIVVICSSQLLILHISFVRDNSRKRFIFFLNPVFNLGGEREQMVPNINNDQIQDFNGAWTRDLAIPVRRSTNWAMKPLTLGAGQFWVHMFPWKIWRWMMHMK